MFQSFKKAMEEAKEILDGRRGVPPSTHHEALDFLNPPKGASLTAVVQEKGWLLNAPEPLPDTLLRAVDPRPLLQELRQLACQPTNGIDIVGLKTGFHPSCKTIKHEISHLQAHHLVRIVCNA